MNARFVAVITSLHSAGDSFVEPGGHHCQARKGQVSHQYVSQLVDYGVLIPAAVGARKAQDDYVALASQGKKYLKQQTISGLEASLDPKNFVRIHRSYLVNLERVSRLEPYAKDRHVVILNDGARLPVSRTGLTRLKELLGQQA